MGLVGVVHTTISALIRSLCCGCRMPSAGAGIREGPGGINSLAWISRSFHCLDDAQNPARPPSGRLPGLLHRATALSTSRIGHWVQKRQCSVRGSADRLLTSTPCPGRAEMLLHLASSEPGSSLGLRHTSSQRWTLVAMRRALGRSTVRTQ